MQVFPTEILAEIGQKTWQAWRLLQQCNTQLRDGLMRINPYATFTEASIIDDDPDEPWVAWKDTENLTIRILVVNLCGFETVMYRDGRNYHYDTKFIRWTPPFYLELTPNARVPWIHIDNICTRSTILTDPGLKNPQEIFNSFTTPSDPNNVARPLFMNAEQTLAFEKYLQSGKLPILRVDHIENFEEPRKILMELSLSNPEIIKKYSLIEDAVNWI